MQMCSLLQDMKAVVILILNLGTEPWSDLSSDSEHPEISCVMEDLFCVHKELGVTSMCMILIISKSINKNKEKLQVPEITFLRTFFQSLARVSVLPFTIPSCGWWSNTLPESLDEKDCVFLMEDVINSL